MRLTRGQSCVFGASLQPKSESINRRTIGALGKEDNVIDTRYFLHKFQDKIRYLQWSERGYVWSRKGEYEVIFSVVFHTVFCCLVQKTLQVLRTEKRNN